MARCHTGMTESQVYDLINQLHSEEKALYKILIEDLIMWKNLMSFLAASVNAFPQKRFTEIEDKIRRKVDEINAKYDDYRLSKEGN